ncbi:SipW-dependent-type signal peptide-containing protein [Janibacter sp. GS2]|uniref:SipW-dependent-type signal peptide-containing protein n=1 Tax=Janibacter sp. GS2 TaxID=3442646 RepID=UPI003EBF9D93
MVTTTGRLGRAALATGLALVVLTGAGGTSAVWSDTAEREPGSLRAGAAAVTKGDSRVEVHSQQPVGSRTFDSSATCTPAGASYKECRVITSTVAREALIPGDRVVITEKVTLTAKGSNLQGTFVIDAGALTSSAVSAFSGSATTTTRITPPGGSAGTSASFPVSARTQSGTGTYTIQSAITTPPANGSADWGTSLWSQRLYDGAYTFTFTQTN